MNAFEEAKIRARELDKLYPNFRHFVGIRYGIVRVRILDDELKGKE